MKKNTPNGITYNSGMFGRKTAITNEEKYSDILREIADAIGWDAEEMTVQSLTILSYAEAQVRRSA